MASVVKSSSGEELFMPGTFTDLTEEFQLGLLNSLLNDIVDRQNALFTGTVDTGDVTDDAISVAATSTTSGNVTVTAAELDIETVTITTNSGFVVIHGKTNLECTADAAEITVRIRKDNTTGTILDAAAVAVADASFNLTSVNIIGVDTSPAASQTYVLTGDKGVSGTVVGSLRVLVAMNFKK